MPLVGVVTDKMRAQMRAMDAQIDARAKIKDYGKTPIEKGVAEGVRVAKIIEEETARMVEAYNYFVEDRLNAVIGALGYPIEDFLLTTINAIAEEENGVLSTTQILSYKGVDLMKFQRFFVGNDGEGRGQVHFVATPIEEECIGEKEKVNTALEPTQMAKPEER